MQNECNAAIDRAIEWVSNATRISSYEDEFCDGRGLILLRYDSQTLDSGKTYAALISKTIRLPEEVRGMGLYSRLFREVEKIESVGMVIHQSVFNSWLPEYHRERGYLPVAHDPDSFFKVVGSPISPQSNTSEASALTRHLELKEKPLEYKDKLRKPLKRGIGREIYFK